MQAGYVSEAFSATVLGGSQRIICHDSDSFLFCANSDKLTIYKPLLNGEPRFGFPPLSTLFNHARENIRRYAQDGYSSNAELFAVSQKHLFQILDLFKKYNADFDTFLDRKWGDGTVRSEFVEDFVPKEAKVSMHAVGKHRKSFLVVTRITIRKFARCFKNILKAGE